MKNIRERLEKKLNNPGIINTIFSTLSNSEFNSFLLECFRGEASKVKPAHLLKEFEQNRFFLPSNVDIILLKELELKWLERALDKGFQTINLSPLAPLGTCSVLGYVHQNNIVSAARGSEVVSDATNVLALKVASDFKISKGVVNYCTTHRHTRAQYFTNPNLSAHFGAFCMVTGGMDTGDFSFELEHIKKHLHFYLDNLLNDFENTFTVKVYFKTENDNFIASIKNILSQFPGRVSIKYELSEEEYYQTIRMKLFINHENQLIDLADMGFVNWTQKLLNNKKHRLLISGSGLELIYKIKSGLI